MNDRSAKWNAKLNDRSANSGSRGLSVAFRGLRKSFGGKEVLRGIDLEVAAGEVMFIIGTSGVGKSVTIKHLVGLLQPDAGELWIGDQRVDQLDEKGFEPIRKRVASSSQAVCRKASPSWFAGRIRWAVSAVSVLGLAVIVRRRRRP